MSETQQIDIRRLVEDEEVRDECELIAFRLGLTRIEIEDIKSENRSTNLWKAKCLQKRKEHQHNYSTYRKLSEAHLECGFNQQASVKRAKSNLEQDRNRSIEEQNVVPNEQQDTDVRRQNSRSLPVVGVKESLHKLDRQFSGVSTTINRYDYCHSG